MPDETDPPRKFYGLKEAEFDAVNQRSDQAQRIDVRAHFQSAAGQSGLPVPKPATKENDVHAMLRDNLARADGAGLNDLSAQPKRPSRRKRDYWFLMIGGNAVLALLFAGAVKDGNAFMMAFSAAGIGAISAGITWVMWFVMDDY
jgi:hypothetical protein